MAETLCPLLTRERYDRVWGFQSGPNQSFLLELNTEDRTLSLGKRNDPEWKALFSFAELDAGLMTLQGELDGHKTNAKLVRFDESKFLLTNRGFHWINESPFNR